MIKVDLAVYNQNRELVLTVEVKTIRNVSEEWASQLRRNILAHGSYPHSRYFLIATPDKFFLWKEQGHNLQAIRPDYVADASTELEPFFKEFGVDLDHISGFIFEQIVARWLKNVMYPFYRNSDDPIPRWIVESDLEKAVLQGDFQFEMAA